MIVNNVSTQDVYIKDLKVTHESQVEGRRGEDIVLGAGESVFLPNTSEVLRSCGKGDIHMMVSKGKFTLGKAIASILDTASTPSIVHGLGYRPTVKVVSSAGVELALEVTHVDMHTLTIKNTSGGDLTNLIVDIG